MALILSTTLGYAWVGINTETPDGSAALDIVSTTGGILIPWNGIKIIFYFEYRSLYSNIK